MATIVNNPSPTGVQDSGSSMGLIVGLLFLIVFAFLLFYYAVPALRRSGGTQITVPDKVDVNVNQPAGQ